MPNYRNRRPTILESDNQTRIPVSTILTDVQLNGEQTKELMLLRLLDGDNKEVGPDIEFKPEEVISGL
jgi:hypothetical protein